MSPQIVLTEKLRRPEAAGLRRARLEAPLLDDTRRLGLVVAPPGSGKTTLLARVAAAAQVPVAWYRVTADDATETALVAHLGRALRDVLDIPIADSAMSGLLGSLERWAGPGAMVILDDLHEIAGTAAEQALEHFVTLRPHWMRVLVGSRRQPGMNIPRLRVSGALHEISSDDLRFRSWEVEELFISIFHEPLSPEAAAALTRRTGGWAAGLQLFHLSTAGRSAVDRQRAVADLGGRSKLVRSYLARNVLAELPEASRQFLLRTCTLGSLTGPLCDALLETTGSGRILDELEQQQLFTSSEDDGTTFRYHEVLRAHLEWALVQEYGPAGARAWYSRSATLLESIGDPRGAVRAHARAEDWGAVARLIQSRGPGPEDATAGADLLLPPFVVQHDPWLSLAEARRRVREGALVAAADGFRQAESLLDEPDFRDSCRRERAVAVMWSTGPAAGPGWLGDARPENRHWSAPLREAILRAPGAHAGPEQSRRRVGSDGGAGPARPAGPGLLLGQGLAALLDGDVRRSSTTLESVLDDPHADSTHRIIAQLASTVIDLMTGDCPDPSASLGQIGLDAELAGLPWVARLARGVQEAVLVATGSPAWRMTACADLLRECERGGDDWGAALLKLVAAVAAQIAGDDADPGDFVDAASRFRRLDAPVLALWSECLQACFQARLASAGAREFAARVSASARALGVTAAAELACTAAAGAGAVAGADRTTGGLSGAGGDLDAAAGLIALITRSATGRPSPGLSTPSQPATATRAGPTPSGPASGLPTAGGPAHPAASEPVLPTAAGSQSPAAIGGGSPLPLPTEAHHTVGIRCFGGFAIEVDTVPVDLGPLRPRARALLRLLALTPDQDTHRERLVDALWPGVDLSVGTRRLQVAVSSVRQLLEQSGLPGSDLVCRHGDAYRLALPPGGSVDVRTFERGLREAAARAARGDVVGSVSARESALALYTGELLPEDGPAEYVVDDRERLRLAAASAAAALAQDNRELGRARQALEAARLSVQLDRFQDLAWTLLVELHEAAGDSSAAARARFEHARVQADLDVIAR